MPRSILSYPEGQRPDPYRWFKPKKRKRMKYIPENLIIAACEQATDIPWVVMVAPIHKYGREDMARDITVYCLHVWGGLGIRPIQRMVGTSFYVVKDGISRVRRNTIPGGETYEPELAEMKEIAEMAFKLTKGKANLKQG